MNDVIVTMTVMFALFGLPVLCFSGVILGISGMWYRYKLAELGIRSLEANSRVHQARLLAGAPDWLDPNNPKEVEAWQRAHIEVVHAAARAQLALPARKSERAFGEG